MIADESRWVRAQLNRCVPAPLLKERNVNVATPEDVIFGKLVYHREGGSEKHVRDITGILRTGFVEVDREYLDRTAKEIGVDQEWRSILDKLGIS